MTNTRANWVRFGAFRSPPVACRRLHCRLATILSPHAPPSSGARGVRSCADPPRLATLTPTAELPQTERGPISTSGPSISLCAEPGDSCAQINPFLSTRRCSPVDRSLVAGGDQRQWIQGCRPHGHQPERVSSPCHGSAPSQQLVRCEQPTSNVSQFLDEQGRDRTDLRRYILFWIDFRPP
jgi:hypothetical protein